MSLTSTDICDILKAAKEANVAKLKLGDLEVEFRGDQGKVNPTLLPHSHHTEVPVNDDQSNNLEFETPSLIRGESEDLLAELEMAQLMTEDPSAYEQFVIDQALEERAIRHAKEDYPGSQ